MEFEEKFVRRVRDYIYTKGCSGTMSGNDIFEFSEIAEEFGVSASVVKENFEKIANALYQLPGVLDVWGEEETGEECFNVSFATNYCGLGDEI